MSETERKMKEKGEKMRANEEKWGTLRENERN